MTPYVRRIYTFGFGQAHVNGYAVVYGVDGDDCRRRMNEAYHGKWAFEYHDEAEAGVAEFDLHRVAVLGPASVLAGGRE